LPLAACRLPLAACRTYVLHRLLVLLLLLMSAFVEAQPTFTAKFLPKESNRAFDYGTNKDSVFHLPLAEMLGFFGKASGEVNFNLKIGKWLFPLQLTKVSDAAQSDGRVVLQNMNARGIKMSNLIVTSEYLMGFFSTKSAFYSIDAALFEGKAIPGLYTLAYSPRSIPNTKNGEKRNTENSAPCDDIWFDYGLQVDQPLVNRFSNFSNPPQMAQFFAQDAMNEANMIWNDIEPETHVLFSETAGYAEAPQPDIHHGLFEVWGSRILDYWSTNRPCVEGDGIFYISGHAAGFNGRKYETGQYFCETPNELGSRAAVVIAKTSSLSTGWVVAHEAGHMLSLNEEENACNESCSQVPYLMCSGGPQAATMSSCMRSIFDSYFSGARCVCASKQKLPPDCLKSPRCYAAVTLLTTDNPHPIKGCITGRDVLNFSVKVEGGCNKVFNTTIQARYRKDVFSVAGISPFSNYFNHVRTETVAGVQYEVLSARNPDGTFRKENFDEVGDLISFAFTTHYEPSTEIEISKKAQNVQVFLGETHSVNAKFASIRPYYPLTALPGQTVLDVLPPNAGVPGGYGYFHINGDLDFPFFYTYPIQPSGPHPPSYIDPLPNQTSGINNYRFTDFHLLMSSGNKIHMNGDTKLILTNSSLEGCATMWKGIELEDAASAEILNSSIKDAQYGFYLKGYNIVDVRNTNFENNNFSVFGINPNINVPPNVKLAGNTYHSTGTLKPVYAGQVPAPVGNKGYAGIYLYNVALLNIDGYTAPLGGGQTDNLFQNLHNGIVVNRVNLNVGKSVFKDISQSALGSGYPINTSGNGIFCTNGSVTQKGFGNAETSFASFDNCHTAVRANFSAVNVSRNRMGKVRFGVRASNTTMKTFTVERNRIEARDAGIFLHQYAKMPNGCKVYDNQVTVTGNPKGVGIRLGGNSFASHQGGKVHRNEVHVQNAAKGMELQLATQLSVHNNEVYLEGPGYVGIQANGGDQNAVLCNYVEGYFQKNPDPNVGSTGDQRAYQSMGAPAHEWSCNTMSGTPLGMEFAGACTGSDIRGNAFSNLNTGLQIGLSPNTGDAYTGPQSHRGNIWDDASLGVGASYLGSVFQVDQSEFVVDNSVLDPATGDDIYLPDVIAGPQIWFQTQSTIGTYSCNGSQQPGFPYNCAPLTFTPLLQPDDARLVAGDGVRGDHFQDALQWSTRRQLYRQILRHGNTYGGDTSVLQLLNDATYASLRAFGDMEHTLRGTYAVSPADSQQMAHANQQIQTLQEQIAPIDSLLDDTLFTYAERQALYGQKAGLLDQAQVFVHLYDSLYSKNIGSRADIAAALLPQYTALAANPLHEQNEKAVASIYLQTFVLDDHNLSAAQKQTLLPIAEQCPIEGGEAVLLAREMLAATDTAVQFYNDATLCQNAQKLTSSQGAEPVLGSFQLSPNPSSGTIHLQYELDDLGHAQFQLNNLLGQNCLRVALKSGRQQETLIISNLPEGVYFWYVLSDAHVIRQGKLVVKH
jgi:hypothetical protein